MHTEVAAGLSGLLALLLFIQNTYLSRTIRSRSSEPGMSVIDHDQPHMAIGVVIDGVHWVADAGYGGKGLRLPIRNDLVHTSTDGHPVVGTSATLLQPSLSTWLLLLCASE